MKKAISTLFLLLICVLSSAGALTQQQKQEVISKINKKTASIKSMSCSFTQTKYLSLLNNKMVSEGKMYYRSPNRLRWEYSTPYKYLFIFNGTKVYTGNRNRKDVIDTNSNKIFNEVARIMMNTVTGQVLTGKTDFSIDVADGKGTWNITLIPKKKDLKNLFPRIVLSFDKKSLLITEINMYEKNNDRTNIQLKGVAANGNLNESLFAIPK